ncbi:isoprenylcysteine carboxyl methyltransferase family protein [Rathayibacter sp. CAU 1779]
MIWGVALIAVIACERIAELVVSASNLRWSSARGGREYAARQVPWMIALHVALLLGCLLEWWLAGTFLPWLGWPMLAIVVLANVLRWWCVGTLGRQWCTRVIVVPGLSPVRRGPYRVIAHPNYLAVAIEGAALPLVFTGWITAIAFTVLNAVFLLGFRIPAEDRALEELDIRGTNGPDADDAAPAGAAADRAVSGPATPESAG